MHARNRRADRGSRRFRGVELVAPTRRPREAADRAGRRHRDAERQQAEAAERPERQYSHKRKPHRQRPDADANRQPQRNDHAAPLAAVPPPDGRRAAGRISPQRARSPGELRVPNLLEPRHRPAQAVPNRRPKRRARPRPRKSRRRRGRVPAHLTSANAVGFTPARILAKN